jgi:hypothetical protein
VSYTVKAKRGTQMSPWSEALTIRFGRIGGGGFAITSTETAPVSEMKLAA